MSNQRILGRDDYAQIQTSFENALNTTTLEVIEDIRNPEDFVYQKLVNPLDADPTTNTQLTVDGSVTPVVFEYSQASEWFLSRMDFSITDAGIRANGFAGINNPLTNGLLVQVIDSDGATIVKDFHDDSGIERTAEFGTIAGTDVNITATAGDDMLLVRFSIFRAGGVMRIPSNNIIRVTVRDDLTSLTRFSVQVQGITSN